MNKRKSISKRLRFEVFKRDSFKCQWCGKSPDQDKVLQVDHIDPVSKGGTNEITNLITSCKDCNSGKSNIRINDNTVVLKQRRQLEHLQEKREQIELMFEWKNQLLNLKEDTVEEIIVYLEKNIPNFSINEKGRSSIKKYTDKYELKMILEAIDLSSSKYLRFNSENELEYESVENFFNKIGGILHNKNRSDLDNKLSYIKGICKNRFNYWDNKKGSIILNNYVDSLKNNFWNDDEIIDDLDKDIIPHSKNSKHWSEWRSVIEKWTDDIKNWEKDNEDSENVYDTDKENDKEFKFFNEAFIKYRNDYFNAMKYIGTSWDNFEDTDFHVFFDHVIYDYLIEYSENLKKDNSEISPIPILSNIWSKWGGYDMFNNNDNTHSILSEAIFNIFKEYLSIIDELLKRSNDKVSDIESLSEKYHEYLNENETSKTYDD